MLRPKLVASTIIAVALLGACGQQDATEEDVLEVLEDAGADRDQAECASERIADELSQDELNDLASANDESDIPEDIDEKITPILDECLGGEAPADEGEPEGSEGSETTETTAEGGEPEATTTTAAG